ATYILTAATYLLIVLAALTASPVVAIALGVLFGAVRGLAVLLSIGITTPARLHAFHRLFDQVGPWVRGLVITVQFGVAGVAAAVAWAPAASVGIGVAAGAGLVALRARPGTTPDGATDAARVPLHVD
ncbi:MAG TPA: hypothetical protein VLV15_11670, partial [Dongiaceae bacterium]|nr:hypothetical protein [Dongiaceae bacterium]